MKWFFCKIGFSRLGARKIPASRDLSATGLDPLEGRLERGLSPRSDDEEGRDRDLSPRSVLGADLSRRSVLSSRSATRASEVIPKTERVDGSEALNEPRRTPI
eukprot:CAMPEP_0184345002 /NCGR_PEP_ID=MMETSP1089-20130417/13469_1 /TAXON_ID=38269 ORGANISM="Gloeochaete wittrockiana, Strain SAG46.84" /NCGR_SAMPLE_ID=MMETSP1089 /ASSEMBLY_ACC=CAM_ASM_000445 /LENGTH=102 /DNA_ID=CAMNT_0026675135 /DNA_START=1244 /DNA_END=1549 /DNA_ORIENTATION=-